jgi:surface polysaccharide O-acyltransferase-like enzyme
MKKRIEWIDFARGIAIFIVVLRHVILGCFYADAFASYKNILWSCYVFFYNFSMPLLFMISGFIHTHTKLNRNYKELQISLLRKLVAFGIPYLIFSISFYWFKSFVGGSEHFLQWKNLFLLIKPIEYYWFLYVLFLIFCIIEILDYIFKNDYVVFTIIVFITILRWNFDTDIFLFDKLSKSLIYFYSGKLLYKRNDLLKNNTLVVFCLITYFALYIFGAYEETFISLNFFMAITMSFTIIAICSRLKTENLFFFFNI